MSAGDLEHSQRLEQVRARRWQAIRAIADRNADKDPEEVGRDVAEAIAAVRAEQRRSTATPKA